MIVKAPRKDFTLRYLLQYYLVDTAKTLCYWNNPIQQLYSTGTYGYSTVEGRNVD
jgi:hypothetical protein